MKSNLLDHISRLDRAAEVATSQKDEIVTDAVPAPPRPAYEEVPLSEAALALPLHIRTVTEPRKLNMQTPFFVCPEWAALPQRPHYLQCDREGTMLPSLDLSRLPFYLFGKSKVCDYTLEHPSISQVHAVLVFHSTRQCFVLLDLNSTNGVRIGGKRIETQRPVPAPAGSVITFGYSTRKYTMVAGHKPVSTRVAVERAKKQLAANAVSPSGGEPADVAERGEAGPAASSSLAPEAEAVAPSPVAIQPAPTPVASSAVATTDAQTGQMSQTVCVDLPEVSGELTEDARVLYHILIKHKDAHRPVSLAPRNRNEPITRSLQDAVDMARFIKASQSGVWTVEAFVQAVQAYSECGTAKKNGLLGVVKRGTYDEAFDEAAFSLALNDVSAPITTALGVHLVFYASSESKVEQGGSSDSGVGSEVAPKKKKRMRVEDPLAQEAVVSSSISSA